MKNILMFSVLAFAVAGLTLMPMQYDAFATKDDNNGKAKGCENANEKSKVSEKNSHCETTVIVQTPGYTSGICTTTTSPDSQVIESTIDEDGISIFTVSDESTSIYVECQFLPPPPQCTQTIPTATGTFSISPGTNEVTVRNSGGGFCI